MHDRRLRNPETSECTGRRRIRHRPGRQRRCRRAAGPRRPRGPRSVGDELRRACLHRARGGLRMARRQPFGDHRHHPDPVRGSGRGGADHRYRARAGTHHSDRLRRGFRRQARSVGAAAGRRRRVGASIDRSAPSFTAPSPWPRRRNAIPPASRRRRDATATVD